MTVTAMATREGNELVERLANAAARLHVEQGATRDEAIQFMEKSMVTLGCSNMFVEADSGKVRIDAVQHFRLTVEQMETQRALS